MKQIISRVRRAIDDYNMIEDGDKIAVALSGGKDSITLLYSLKSLQYFYPKHFDLIAISVNPGFNFFNESIIQKICNNINIPLFIENYNIKEIVFTARKEQNPCSLCANLRRGILNSIAIKENCNKLALGHNEDDALETFLMNFFYAGNLSTFSPVSFMSNSNITAIRPIIYLTEKDIKKYIKRENISVMPKTCPIDGFSSREEMKKLISTLSIKLPFIRSNMIGAIKRNNISGWKDFKNKTESH